MYATILNNMKKQCRICNISKMSSRRCFAPAKGNGDGLSTVCRKCDNYRRMERYNKNKDIERIRNSEYRKKNRTKLNRYTNEYVCNRRKEDTLFRLMSNLRSRVRIALSQKKFVKSSNFSKSIGCSPEELKKHIESQFESWMTWDNYGPRTWHIDHKVPLSMAKNPEELYSLNHFSNLRPLSATDNLKKGNRK